MARNIQETVEFPKGVVAELDVIRKQDWRRGVLITVDRTPVRAFRRTDPKTGRQRRTDGKYGWEVTGSPVTLYYNGYLGTYLPGTKILTDRDPTTSRKSR